MVKTKMAPWLALMLFPAHTWAAALEYNATVENTQVVAGEPFRLSVTVVAEGSGSLQEFTLPDVGQLRVLGNSRQEGTQVQIGAGGALYKHTIAVTLTLVADHPGKAVIGKGTARLGQDVAQSAPLTLRVLPAGASPHQGTPARPATPDPGQPYPSPPQPAPPDAAQNGVRATPAMLKAGLFASLEVDRSQVMLGEQVTLAVKIYSRAELSEVESPRLPKMEGFWTETLENPQRINSTPVLVEGYTYQSYLVRRLAVFPTRAGTFEWAPMEADVTVGGGFFSTRRHRVQSLPLTLVVDPLPAAGQPASFQTGNVGHFTLSARLDRERIGMGQAATVTVRVEGHGNLRQVTVPRLMDTADYRVFDPTPSEDIKVKSDRFVGYKQLEFLIQPKRAGALDLGPLRLDFYDTTARTYQAAHAPALRLTVTPADGTQDSVGAPRGNVLAMQARPLRTITNFGTGGLPLLSDFSYAPLLITAPLLLGLCTFLGGGILRLRHRKRQQDVGARVKETTQHLITLAQNGAGAQALHEGVYGFLAARVDPRVLGMTRAELDRALLLRGVESLEAARLVKLLDQLDAARYSPQGSTTLSTPLALEALAVVRSLNSALEAA